ncbi:MAG: hypothetical protein RQ743_01810 [Bacteroidales bacterium]|nr:hypothetical protein [Bacteroidales bacterium]
MKYPEVLFFFQVALICQPAGAQVTDEINYYFTRIIASTAVEERLVYNDSIAYTLLAYLESVDDIVATDIPGVNYLGQISSSDSLLKFFTWNVPISNGNNLYNCIIYNDSLDQKIFLKGDAGLQTLDADKVLKASEWYGSLYYDVQPLRQEDHQSYILLGFDPDNLNGNAKVVEILQFNKDGEAVFGEKVFGPENGDQARMIFKYSPLATMMLRFSDDRSRIVFDHLSPTSEQFGGMYKYYGPDFSHDALEIRDGMLILVEDIDLRNISN